jgi:hypothetical protein
MTYIVEDFLTKDEIIDLYEVFALYASNGNTFPESGRYIVSTTQISEYKKVKKILDKIENLVTEKYNKPMKVATTGFHLYNIKFGKPKLPPHIDDYAGEVVFDYQIASNICWPLKVDKKEYALKDNSALIFQGETTPHGRVDISFNNFDFVMMFIVNLIGNDHWYNFNDKNPQPINEIMDKINFIRTDKENW